MRISTSVLSAGEHIGCPFATQEESGFEDELPAFSFLSFDPIMVAEQFTLMDAVSGLPFSCRIQSQNTPSIIIMLLFFLKPKVTSSLYSQVYFVCVLDQENKHMERFCFD